MNVYVIIEKYYDEDYRIVTDIRCICKDKDTAKDKIKEYAKKQLEEQFEYEDWVITSMKDYECVLDSMYESLVFRINKWEVI